VENVWVSLSKPATREPVETEEDPMDRGSLGLVKRENSVKSEPSPIQMFPCLSAFEATVQAHSEVLGALYTGSLGRGTFDRYLDLDIDLWVPDAWLEDGPSRLREVMGWLGEVQVLYGGTGFVGPEWQRVDLLEAKR
jgi:hypothetical protein